VPLAGLIHTHGPVSWPAQADDSAYITAEWQALSWAWLHGLPAVVVNRPQPARAAGAFGAASPVAERALWCQRFARAGLPVWPLAGTGMPAPAGERWAWMVAGRRVVPAVEMATQLASRRLAAVARAAGVDWLAVSAAPDPAGRWRITGASTAPDLRRFGDAGCAALAAFCTAAAAR
jgi:hypothetical protein